MAGRPEKAALLKVGTEARPTNLFWFPGSCLGAIFFRQDSVFLQDLDMPVIQE